MTSNTITIKCRKCRTILVETNHKNILNAHSNLFFYKNNSSFSSSQEISCESIEEQKEIFLNEDNLPLWIIDNITESEWTKGKLKCNTCDARVGSFDFVSGMHCKCGKHSLPSIHLVKSKVDYPINFNDN